ncbi:MAG: glycosyltransferase [Fibrobacter sp.]|nr:glycosyltransferase [Fibrobacter sp.]
MNIFFFSSHTFLAREVANALQKLKGCRIIIINIPQYPDKHQVASVLEKLRPFLPGLAFFINDAGSDFGGELIDALTGSGCLIINWYTDYPFYEEIFQHRSTRPGCRRIDLVSEESFVPEMIGRGFKAYFMPLGVDTSYFNTDGEAPFCRDIAFVGNSSCEFLDFIVNEKRAAELEKLLPLQVTLKKLYYSDPRRNLNSYLLENRSLWEGKTDLNEQELLFTLEWLTGYFYRRDFIKKIAGRYGARFTCFGDPYWQNFIDPSLVSTDACYYTNLCKYYRSTRINLNVNRIQIRTSFTQRVFDCAASGGFLLTDRREMNARYFKISGSDREIVQYDSLEQCFELIDYYLEHEQERTLIAEAARKKVLSCHTYDHRIAQILDICRREWSI